jgi:hypothetical protein
VAKLVKLEYIFSQSHRLESYGCSLFFNIFKYSFQLYSFLFIILPMVVLYYTDL